MLGTGNAIWCVTEPQLDSSFFLCFLIIEGAGGKVLQSHNVNDVSWHQKLLSQ
jgi:hypothetical protein